MKCPCYKCEYRHLHCHADCEGYKAYVIEREQIRHKRLIEREVNNARAYNFEKKAQDNYRRRRK